MRVVFVKPFCAVLCCVQHATVEEFQYLGTSVHCRFSEKEGFRESLFLQACCDKSHKDKGYIHVYIKR